MAKRTAPPAKGVMENPAKKYEPSEADAIESLARELFIFKIANGESRSIDAKVIAEKAFADAEKFQAVASNRKKQT